MGQHPVGHKAAIARPQRALPRLVEEGIRRLGIVQPLHQVLIGPPAPVAAHLVDKLLPIPRRPAPIDPHHHIPIRRQQLPVPAIAPRIPQRRLRPSMHHKLHRILLRRIKPRRPQDKPLNLRSLRPHKPERLHLRQIKLVQHRIVQMGFAKRVHQTRLHNGRNSSPEPRLLRRNL